MKEVKGFIRIGFFEDFDGENSILITADFNGLLQLEKAFEKLSEGKKILLYQNLN